tara:strand:- start:4923 stop:5279 length:357 start_codon:yes stop_codon:yes gene_type:complete
MSDTEYTPSFERVRDVYSWAYAWRTRDNVDEGDTDLSGLRESNRAEFDRALAAHDREVAAKAAKQALRVLADELVGGSSLLWYGRKAIPREELVDMLRNDNASLIASIKPFQKGAKRG